MNSQIGLIDCNNFFVSCERLFRPDLDGMPVLVLSSNDGCVVARSQEVKDMGIPMGVPYFKVKDILKDKGITVFSGNLTLYRDISRRVFTVVQNVFPQMEQYSVDEAFFVVSSGASNQNELVQLRAKIAQEVGIPVSIGVAATKTLAKVAASQAKRGSGVATLDQTTWPALAAQTSLASVWGVGNGLSAQFRAAGMSTVEDLLQADSGRVRALFGVNGERLQAELQGKVAQPVTRQKPLQQSLMSSRSFGSPTTEKSVLSDALAYHVRHVAADLRAMQAVAKTLRISLRTSRHGDFFLYGGSDTVVLTAPTADTFALLREAQASLNKLYELGVPYQKVGFTVSEIRPVGTQTGDLFAAEEQSGSAATTDLFKTIDTLNSAAGRELLTVGSYLKTPTWQAKATRRSDCYTTRWSDLATVSAG